ncbi:MAG: dehydrogenase, partial [Asticcacaulis sp.]|nr:dehydrogenase [Asticcacaulis sp.]
GGRQDQYAATFGGFNFMEFQADERVIVNPLRIGSHAICELEASLVLFFTGASRQSARVIDTQTKAVEAGGKSLEAMHQLKQEAVAMKEALLFGRIKDVAEVLRRGWEAKKATSAAVSTAQIDQIYADAMDAGALAGKVSGAGGGGFMMFLVDPVKRAQVTARLGQEPFGSLSFCNFTSSGARTWRVR